MPHLSCCVVFSSRFRGLSSPSSVRSLCPSSTFGPMFSGQNHATLIHHLSGHISQTCVTIAARIFRLRTSFEPFSIFAFQSSSFHCTNRPAAEKVTRHYAVPMINSWLSSLLYSEVTNLVSPKGFFSYFICALLHRAIHERSVVLQTAMSHTCSQGSTSLSSVPFTPLRE